MKTQEYGVVNDSSLPLPKRIPLRAGPLTMVFEPETVFLRYVRHGSGMVLLGLYAAVRDHNWDTAPPRITRFAPDIREDSFDLSFTVEAPLADIRFTWEGRLTGTSDGTITFDFDGVAGSTFRRNRIGFCVLHPMTCAGKVCVVETVSGAVSEGAFPDAISPHQPFFDLRALTHPVTPRIWAEVRMEGDTFEMEDQRNWTDASYKTYCTPLALPFPAEVAEGTRVQQRVSIRLLSRKPDGSFIPFRTVSAEASVASVALADVVTPASPFPATTQETPLPPDTNSGDPPILLQLVPNTDPVPLPQIGLGIASHGQPLTENEIKHLTQLHLAHLRADLRLGGSNWETLLDRVLAQAHALQTALELALHIPVDGAEAALSVLTDRVANLPDGVTVARFLVFADGEKSVTEAAARIARKHLKTAFPTIPLVGGTDAYFTELNRFRPPVELLDGLTYSINPQVHAFDDASLVETLAAQAETVRSARTFANGLPISVSPVTLRPRFNPNATGPEPEPASGELPSSVDPRQCTPFAGAWTVGSIKYLAESGVASVTYYETTGWRGVMETDAGSSLPEKFPSTPGKVFPLWGALHCLSDFVGGNVLPSVSSDPLSVEGLILEDDQWRGFLIANLTGEVQKVLLPASVRFREVPSPERYGDTWQKIGNGIMLGPGASMLLEFEPYEVKYAQSPGPSNLLANPSRSRPKGRNRRR